MNKAYQKMTFVNGQEPDLDAENLNAISTAIDTIDNRVVAHDSAIDAIDGRVTAHDTAIESKANKTNANLIGDVTIDDGDILLRESSDKGVVVKPLKDWMSGVDSKYNNLKSEVDDKADISYVDDELYGKVNTLNPDTSGEMEHNGNATIFGNILAQRDVKVAKTLMVDKITTSEKQEIEVVGKLNIGNYDITSSEYRYGLVQQIKINAASIANNSKLINSLSINVGNVKQDNMVTKGLVGDGVENYTVTPTIIANKIMYTDGTLHDNDDCSVYYYDVNKDNLYIDTVQLKTGSSATVLARCAFFDADNVYTRVPQEIDVVTDEDGNTFLYNTELYIPNGMVKFAINVKNGTTPTIYFRKSLTNSIIDLQNKPSGIVLTSSSPLQSSAKANILGIDAKGRSWQKTIQFEQGTLVSEADGKTYEQAKQDRTDRIRFNDVCGSNVGNTITVTVASTFEAMVKTFNANKIYVGSTGWGTSVSIASSNYYVIILRKTSGGNIVPSDASSANIVISGAQGYTPTPTSPIPIVDASTEVTAIGKNLFDKEKIVNGYLDGNGNVVSNPQYRVSDYIEVGHSQITISGNKGGNEVICFFAEDKTRVSFFAMGSNNIKTLDVPQNAKFVRCTVSADNLNVYQVELGATATAYVPYQSNTITLPYTLKSVGNVADELVVNEDGSGQIVQRVGEGILTNVSQISYTKSAEYGDYATVTSITDAKVGGVSREELLCDRAINCTFEDRASASWLDTYRIYQNQRGIVIRPAKKTYANASEFFAEWNGATIYYILDTPIETSLTPEEVASIRALQTYKGTTVIESEMQIDSVTYSGDVKAYVDSKTDYSYTDQIIGKWADGKDLHRMVIQTTTPSAENTDTEVATLPTGANIKRIDGTLIAGENTDAVNFYYGSTYYIATWVKSGKVRMRLSASYTSKPCEIIVEYTLKNTATASVMSLSLDEGGEE